MHVSTNFDLNKCKYDFNSDKVDIIVMIYDRSGSMEPDVNKMRKANKAFYDDFSKFKDKGSIAIAKVVFSDSLAMSPFTDISQFNTGYDVGGGTALYLTIEKVTNYVIMYYEEIQKRLNITPRITFLVFTDGQDTTHYSSSVARHAITKLNSLDATTVLVAFREAIQYDIGAELGFTCTKNIESAQELISCLGEQLSQSCKEQSKSVYSLKSEFFSKASTDAEEDSVEDQSILADDFFNV